MHHPADRRRLVLNRRSVTPSRKVISGPLEFEEAMEVEKEDDEEPTGICCQAEYNSCTDDDEDEDALLSSDNADAAKRASQSRKGRCAVEQREPLAANESLPGLRTRTSI
ncbi:hypothetical protein PF006_g20000 [Phytophthora fragariae]|nr:hypothetical protein PF009_g22380 [Phytophthora fragariae]KAE9112336.1 hypothetical protein PF006_g20000 [Phytophthora fragariae]